ncbi:class I SAM-dependent methyltransferase [Nonomuraea terrae]|uniref:class I SAM-dependent methyltransferase n=1 Tax=Nonomuraea terrae TaxID=2530383 RepID=UPI0037AC8D68
MSTATYGPGHSEQELDRLIQQASFFGDLTEHVLVRAGLQPGMRVLDVGCGSGDVSFLAARLVGGEGSVIGLDNAEAAVGTARARAAAARLDNVHFVLGDLAEHRLDLRVDAVIGRLVLMYLPDAVAALAHLRTLLAPGGLMVFQEVDLIGATSEPPCPLLEATVARVAETLRRVGGDVRTGLRLPRLFTAAGLPRPRMIMGARVESGPDSPMYDQIVGVTRTLLAPMEQTGVATASEVDLDTLDERLRAEVAAASATVVLPHFVGAWAQLPGGADA